MPDKFRQLAVGDRPAETTSPDGTLYEQLRNLAMPHTVRSKPLLQDVAADDRFGNHPLGHEVSPTDLVVQAPTVVEFRIASKARRPVARWSSSGLLDPRAGRDGTVRLEAGPTRVEPSNIGTASPIVLNKNSPVPRIGSSRPLPTSAIYSLRTFAMGGSFRSTRW